MAGERDRGPIDQVLDLVVFAPLGLLLELQKESPRLAERARSEFGSQIRTARMIGEFAVKQGRRELNKRLTPTDGRVEPRTRSSVSPPPAAVEATSASTASVSAQAAPVSADELPIAGYELLSAAQLVGLLADLTPAGLDEVEGFERQHRNRKTVLGKIAQLRA